MADELLKRYSNKKLNTNIITQLYESGLLPGALVYQKGKGKLILLLMSFVSESAEFMK